ncbi:MAG TPA: transposase [Clostridiales bacterium]|nr:transposase [Clostridiales bacterium]
MDDLPKRKKNRLDGYDYSSCGAYFVTLCVSGRQNQLWENEESNCIHPQEAAALSETGKIVEKEIRRLNITYESVAVDKYCIMSDHIHLIIFFLPDLNERAQRVEPVTPPTLSRVIKQFKGAITKQIGYSIWQKSFYDKIIRSEKGYRDVWEYVDTNPYRWIDVL